MSSVVTNGRNVNISMGDKGLSITLNVTGIRSIIDSMAVYYDGSISDNELIDLSGNNRNATLTSNLVSDPGAEFDSSWSAYFAGGTAASINGTINTDSRPGSSGSRCYRFRWESVSAFANLGSERFITKAGETITFSFWAKRLTSTTINVFMQNGTGSATDSPNINIALGTYLVEGSNTVGEWGKFQTSFTAGQDGGLAQVRCSVAAGTHEVLIDDIEVVVTGETNNCFVLPDDATLKAIDSKNHFYTSTGIPLTTRAAWQHNALVNQIYCGGAFKYIFLKESPTIQQDYVLSNYFEDLDFIWDSCPTVYSIGSGKTYASYNEALTAWTSLGTFRHRVKMEVYDNLSASVYADYLITVSIGKGFIILNKQFIYLDGIGDITITGSKEVDASDAQLTGTEFFSPLYDGGVRNIDFIKNRGGYFYHQDSTPMEDRTVVIKGCTFTEQGDNGVFAYRTANALPQPSSNLSESVLAGGMHPNFMLKLSGSTFTGQRPISWQDADMEAGDISNVYIRDCTLNSIGIIDQDNATGAVKESYRLTSTGLGETNIFAINTARNSTINKSGGVESIFLTEK